MTPFKITRAEKAAIVVTLIFAAFILGIFVGRKTVKPVGIDSAEAETSIYVYAGSENTTVQDADTTAEASSEATSVHETTEPAADQESSTASTAEETPELWTVDSGTQLNLNQASLEELENLPSIGPVLAQAILDYRQSNGDYQSVDELLNVDGIGEKTLEKIREYVKVGD